jgi:beta-N-acetylhexosaminidase
MGNAFVEELRDSGVLACGKHFPGHGAVKRDPHFTLPQIDKPKKLLLMEDIPPFVNLFPVLPMIMVGHGHFPALAENRAIPACLSPRIVRRLLRKKLGFPGVVLTDDMSLGAVTSLGLTPEKFLEALEAGNDMLLFSQTTPLVEQAFQLIVRSARRSPALSNRITASVQRILALKQRIGPPVRNRANVRTRILRHIDRLSREVEVAAARTLRV